MPPLVDRFEGRLNRVGICEKNPTTKPSRTASKDWPAGLFLDGIPVGSPKLSEENNWVLSNRPFRNHAIDGYDEEETLRKRKNTGVG